MLAQNASSCRASWVMGFIPFFFTVSLYELSCSAVDMRWSWYCEFKCVLSAHDWILLHSSLLHLWLQKFGILSNRWPQHKCNFSVSSLGMLSQLPWSHVQLCPAASSFTHNPDLLGVLQWSLCSNVVVELYAWMLLNPKKEQVYRKPQCRIQWG